MCCAVHNLCNCMQAAEPEVLSSEPSKPTRWAWDPHEGMWRREDSRVTNMITVFDYLKGCIRVEGAGVFSVFLEGRTRLDGRSPAERFQCNVRSYCMVEGPSDISHTFYWIHPSQGWTMMDKPRMAMMPVRGFKC